MCRLSYCRKEKKVVDDADKAEEDLQPMKKCCHNCYRFYFCSIARKGYIWKKNIWKKNIMIQINLAKYHCLSFRDYKKTKGSES